MGRALLKKSVVQKNAFIRTTRDRREEKARLAARVFGGEELAGQVKELHDHLKAKDGAILPAQGNYLIL